MKLRGSHGLSPQSGDKRELEARFELHLCGLLCVPGLRDFSGDPWGVMVSSDFRPPKEEVLLTQERKLYIKIAKIINEIFASTQIIKFTNLVCQRYNVANVNDIWTLDTTERAGISIPTLIDLASRLVVDYLIADKDPTSSEIIALIEQAINKHGRVKKIHFDCLAKQP